MTKVGVTGESDSSGLERATSEDFGHEVGDVGRGAAVVDTTEVGVA